MSEHPEGKPSGETPDENLAESEADHPSSEPAAEEDASVASEGLEACAEQYPDIAEKSASILAVFEDLKEKLGTTRKAKEALEADLAAVRDEAAGLQGKLTFANGRLRELRARCEEQEAEIRDLSETNRSLEQSLTVMTTRHDAARNELNAVKTALGRIHAAAQASRRSPKRQDRPTEGEQV